LPGSTGKNRALRGIGVVALLCAGLVNPSACPGARSKPIAWTEREKPVVEGIHRLRLLPDKERARHTRQLALDIRKLPAGAHKLLLVNGLAGLLVDGDFGRAAPSGGGDSCRIQLPH
jgi:hypothetical protein